MWQNPAKSDGQLLGEILRRFVECDQVRFVRQL